MVSSKNCTLYRYATSAEELMFHENKHWHWQILHGHWHIKYSPKILAVNITWCHKLMENKRTDGLLFDI